MVTRTKTATYREFKRFTLAVARGARKPRPGEPRIWAEPVEGASRSMGRKRVAPRAAPRVRVAAALGALLAAVAPGARAQPAPALCHNTLWQMPGAQQTAETVMRVASGQPCRAAMNLLGAPRLLQPPGNGEVAVEASGYTYRSRPGFAGRDRFQLAWAARIGDGRTIQKTLTVSVEVVR